MVIVIDIFGVGMWIELFVSLLVNLGSVLVMVLVVFVLVSIILSDVVWLWCLFLWKLLIRFWLLVKEWMVLMCLEVMLKWLFIVFNIGVIVFVV